MSFDEGDSPLSSELSGEETQQQKKRRSSLDIIKHRLSQIQIPRPNNINETTNNNNNNNGTSLNNIGKDDLIHRLSKDNKLLESKLRAMTLEKERIEQYYKKYYANVSSKAKAAEQGINILKRKLETEKQRNEQAKKSIIYAKKKIKELTTEIYKINNDNKSLNIQYQNIRKKCIEQSKIILRKNNIISEWEIKYNEIIINNGNNNNSNDINNDINRVNTSKVIMQLSNIKNELKNKNTIITQLKNILNNFTNVITPFIKDEYNGNSNNNNTINSGNNNESNNNSNNINNNSDTDDTEEFNGQINGNIEHNGYNSIIISNNNINDSEVVHSSSDDDNTSDDDDDSESYNNNDINSNNSGNNNGNSSNKLKIPFMMKKSNSDLSVDGDGIDKSEDNSGINFDDKNGNNNKRRDKPPNPTIGKKRGSIKFNDNNIINTNNNNNGTTKKRRRSFVSSELNINTLKVRVSPPNKSPNNKDNNSNNNSNSNSNSNSDSINNSKSPRSDIATPSPAPPPPEINQTVQTILSINNQPTKHRMPHFNKSRQSTEDEDEDSLSSQ